MLIFAFVIVLILITLVIQSTRKPHKYPPGKFKNFYFLHNNLKSYTQEMENLSNIVHHYTANFLRFLEWLEI